MAGQVIVRLTQIDGALPNLALMKLAAWHRAQGDEVHVTRQVERDMFEPPYDKVYGSTIFDFSRDRLERFQRDWPDAIVGGTGSGSPVNVESITGDFEGIDYSGYPDFAASIGFTQRGCRLKCKFCVVPGKEGKNRPVGSIASIWRGDPHPRRLHLLDNDFFGNPEWRERIAEIRDGGFEVCLSQGINVRLINEEAAAALATIKYKNTDFARKQLYTAWDNLGDERVFFRGVDLMEAAGHRAEAPHGLHADRLRPAGDVGPHLAPLRADGRARHQSVPDGLRAPRPRPARGPQVLPAVGDRRGRDVSLDFVGRLRARDQERRERGGVEALRRPIGRCPSEAAEGGMNDTKYVPRPTRNEAMTPHKHCQTTDEAKNALEAIASALSKARGAEQEQLTMIATIAICMLHGTFGKEFVKGYLYGAIDEMELPNPMVIKLEVRDSTPSH